MSDAVLLYEHPLSPYAQKVKLALREKGIDFDVTMPAFGTEEAAEFSQLNPRGEVPVLVHHQQAIFETPVILAYLEDTWPSPPLLPDTPTQRARVRMIESAMDTHFEANTWGMGEVTVFGRAPGELGESLLAIGKIEIRGWFDWLDGQLGDADWFNGDAFGYGDICVIPHVNGAARFDVHPAANSKLAAWLARANSRETVQLTHQESIAAELDPAIMQAALATGFKREYRDHRLEWMVRGGGLEVVRNGIDVDNIRFNSAFARRE